MHKTSARKNLEEFIRLILKNLGLSETLISYYEVKEKIMTLADAYVDEELRKYGKKVGPFAAVSEDWSNCVDHFEVNLYRDNWIKYFSDIEKAKKFCEIDYDCEGSIQWIKQNTPQGIVWYSGDLGNTVYRITKVKIEE